ncbi:MAG: alkaline phosphatase PhoX, partial [Candidatus Limnocylindrales bacterium]
MRMGTVAGVAALALATPVAPALALSNVKPYAVGVSGTGYATKPLWSVGESVPETSDPSKQYQMIGIPDGLGAHRVGHGRNQRVVAYMNHEMTGSTVSETIVGVEKNRGAIVTKAILDRDGNVLSAERAYDSVYLENTYVGPAAEVGNSTRAFSRFCSGSLAWKEHNFDRPIYFANEEEGTPANSFDGKGGLAVAVTGNKAYALPKLGHFAWENTLIQPTKGKLTVAMGMEDGPNALAQNVENSQLYMYVGRKERHAGAGVLRRNGLDNGELYVLARADGVPASEADFASGSFRVKWVLIPNADDLDEGQLEAASDAVNAIRFARLEDGAFNLKDPDRFVFVTTGGAAGANVLGRLYELKLARNPLANGWLTVVYSADHIIAAGGDIAISPDNIEVSRDHLMIQEDGTAESRAVMESKNREGSIWRFDIGR